jgi:16S rRNA G966 N2-methylase RsmD
LNNHFSFEGLKILDLFAGTGNISYEFASRGSTPITSVDGDFGCVKFIKQVATEYDFNIAATKVMFSPIERCKTSYDIILQIRLAFGPKNVRKIILLVFERTALMKRE